MKQIIWFLCFGWKVFIKIIIDFLLCFTPHPPQQSKITQLILKTQLETKHNFWFFLTFPIGEEEKKKCKAKAFAFEEPLFQQENIFPLLAHVIHSNKHIWYKQYLGHVTARYYIGLSSVAYFQKFACSAFKVFKLWVSGNYDFFFFLHGLRQHSAELLHGNTVHGNYRNSL